MLKIHKFRKQPRSLQQRMWF